MHPEVDAVLHPRNDRLCDVLCAFIHVHGPVAEDARPEHSPAGLGGHRRAHAREVGLPALLDVREVHEERVHPRPARHAAVRRDVVGVHLVVLPGMVSQELWILAVDVRHSRDLLHPPAELHDRCGVDAVFVAPVGGRRAVVRVCGYQVAGLVKSSCALGGDEVLLAIALRHSPDRHHLLRRKKLVKDCEPGLARDDTRLVRGKSSVLDGVEQGVDHAIRDCKRHIIFDTATLLVLAPIARVAGQRTLDLHVGGIRFAFAVGRPRDAFACLVCALRVQLLASEARLLRPEHGLLAAVEGLGGTRRRRGHL
mmetsp:Transcript_23183/g.68317  ORF Transcript_23183/g.68317 Transcript_23183/m.68317 type:complete len:310 (-) Transcript_23183:265-1194(-)